MRLKKNDIKIRSSYDFLEPTDEMPECVPVPKELGKKFKAEVEAARLARQNRPKFRVTDNLFSGGGFSGGGGVMAILEVVLKRNIVVVGFLAQPALLSIWTR
ncbi:hypothetical protein [Helicobacter pylori]|uniref:hypothetical protein n=1 Tax=Helicobacter pylori TaxID=210 RepID=UPI00196AFF57|nr:hypothetical protein [Helicobacter pylori]